MKGFKLNTDSETIYGLFNVSEERAKQLDQLFVSIGEKIFKDSLSKDGFNQCEVYEQFTNEAETDNEVHYAIARASSIIDIIIRKGKEHSFKNLLTDVFG